ncbi:MAG: GNAT family N-acetyltransferase [Blastocatellia bacterium]
MHRTIFPSDTSDPSAQYEDWIINGIVFVAESERTIIGFGAIRWNTLWSLYVLPGSQSRGVGSEILKEMEDCAKGQDVTWLKTYAHAPQPERQASLNAFYEHRGYVKQLDNPDASGVDFVKRLM